MIILMKILVTGAHFTPAVATIEELKKIGGLEVVYVGRRTTQEGDTVQSVESKALPTLGVKFIPIIAGRLQRAFTIHTIPSLLKIPIGLLQALFIVLSEKPDVILSFGGYVAVPIVIIGWLFSIPVIVHEQALVSGLANRISSAFADKIALSFEGSDLKSEKIILTGLPIRRSIVEIQSGISRRNSGLPIILVMGGNQGSHAINLALEGCLGDLLKRAVIYHQTGDSKYKDYERLKESESDNYKVFKFINEDWGKILVKCDLVISRAGINTLAELAFLGKPVLLIPIPNSEQNKNAKYFEELGLAKVLPQSKLSSETLMKNIRVLLNNLDNLKEKAKESKKIIIPDAAKKLVLETILLGEKIEI